MAGWSRNWPAQVSVELGGGAAARIGGGRDWFHIPAPAEHNRSDGMIEGASHVHHRRAMTAAHDRHILNFQRYARDHPDPTAATGYDAIQSGTNGAVPVSLRGGGPVAIPPYRDAASIVIAGAPSDLLPEEGQVAWNSAALTVHRKLGGAGVGSWQAVDVKHFPAGGYALMARMACDAMMASEGTGPPFASPHELLTAVDVAVGVVIGRLPHTGVATSMSLTMNRARLVPLATLAIAAGSAITRIGTGVLTPGMQTLHAWTSNAAGTLRTTVDVYVDAAAGAAPSRFTVGGTGVSLYGRESHGLTNGQQIAEAMLVRIDSLATVPFYAARPPQQLDDGLTVLRGAGRCCCFRGRSTGAWRRTGGRCSIRRDCRWCGHRSRRSRG